MNARTAAAAAALAYAFLELAAHLLVRKHKPDFPWLITAADVAPDIPADLVAKHAARSFDPELGWCRRPGERGTEPTTGGEVSFSLDGRGRRSNPGFDDRPARVACFGDSFVFCRLVNDDQTWPHHLSRLLDAPAANYGVGNYGLDQALLRLERELPGLDADVVVMGVVPETIARVHSYWKHYFEYGNTLAFKPRFTREPGGLRLHPSPIGHPGDYATYRERLADIQRLDGFYRRKFRRDVLRFPHLPRLASRWRRHAPILGHLLWGTLRRDGDRGRQRAFQAVLRDNARWTDRLYRDEEAAGLLRALVARFADTCRQAGKSPVLLVIPQLVDLEGGHEAYAGVFARMRDLLPVVDVTGHFRASGDLRRLFAYGKLGPHPSDAGNTLIAAALAPAVAVAVRPLHR